MRRFIAAILLLTAASAAADEKESSEAEAASRFQERAKLVVKQYVVRADGQTGRELTRQSEPLLRWTNPLGGQQAHGEVYLWTDRGAPAAVLSLYELTRDTGIVEHHEWSSLSAHGLSVMGPATWAPQEPGLEFRPLPGAPAPADTARARLRQMKDLAAEFSAEKTTRSGEIRPLRLLSQPLYRYSPDEAAKTDVALFAFVEGTDPETLLVLESRTRDGKSSWHFAIARMSNVELKVSRNDGEVWHAEMLPWKDAVDRPDKSYSAFGVR